MIGNFFWLGLVNFICVDVNREMVFGGEYMYVDKMIYLVEVKCGVFFCLFYVDGYFVYCVVCIK